MSRLLRASLRALRRAFCPTAISTRNDGTFAALGRHDGAFSMNENRPYPMLVIGAAIGFAIVLMIWSMAGTSNTGTSNEANRGSAQTTGSNTSGSNHARSNDAAQ